jgi:hypothetical protein
MVTIPVVAHRLFGTRMRRATVGRMSGRISMPAGLRSIPPMAGFLDDEPVAPTTVWLPEIDRSHGTRRGTDEIEAFFASNPALDFTRAMTVNDIWSPIGVNFRLIESVEHSIASDLADMMLHDTRVYRSLAERLGRTDAVNLFLVRGLVGAVGRSGGVYAPGDRIPAYAYLSDNHDLERTFDRWEHELVVLAHEFGHCFGLPHMPDAGNLMQPAASNGATGVTMTQRRIVEARSMHFPHV